MHRPPLRVPGAYECLLLAVREVVDTGGDVPCLRPDSPAEWWFSDDDSKTRHAKERCRVCPVILACDRHAVLNDEHGVWAGRTRAERHSGLVLLAQVVVAVHSEGSASLGTLTVTAGGSRDED